MDETQQFRKKIQEAIGKIDSPEGISDLFRELRYPKRILFETPLKRNRENKTHQRVWIAYKD